MGIRRGEVGNNGVSSHGCRFGDNLMTHAEEVIK